MNRRALLLPMLLAGCGLAERPYAERRQWPLAAARPAPLAARANGRVLEVRSFRAGPGLEARGLQTLGADGSIRTEFYEEWSVPPAQGVEDSVRGWLGAAGLFAAVVASGSRAVPDLVLEGEVTALWAEPARGIAHAAVGITVLSAKGDAPRVLLQRRVAETAALAGPDAPAATQAMLAALSIVCARVEAELRRLG